MNRKFVALFNAFIVMLVMASSVFAQNRNNISLILVDSSNDEPVPFATVSVTKKGATSALKYSLTGSDGKATLEKIAAGTYTLKAEMMGYVSKETEIVLEGKDINLGNFKIDPDREVLDAASVSAVGNPIVVKKDTVEYNASSFKITDNDVLEDLLKKFPGIEVGEDGSITANGQTITKIYVDGKTFFMDDPALASKNLPAKIVNKVKVVRKKSDQAAFTGIDDGEEETVLDLSVKQGMMNGVMGNLRAGIGHDFPSSESLYDEHRYTGNLFLGNFSTGTQYAVIGNANNGNNVGFGGFGRGMMGGGRGGVTTSYMIGANVGKDFLDGDLETTADYSFNGSERDSRSKTYQEQYFKDANDVITNTLISNSQSSSLSDSQSHNIGMRIESKLSKSASMIFEPQINFGTGSNFSDEIFTRYNDEYNDEHKIKDGYSRNTSDSKNVSASGRLQYRQRLGIPGRTLVVNSNFSLSNNRQNGMKQSLTDNFLNGEMMGTDIVNQRTVNNSKNVSVTGRATYTEPLGNNFYAEANYSMTWRRQNSEQLSFDSGATEFTRDNFNYNPNGEKRNDAYSNTILNESLNQQIGANLLYQSDALRAQVGVSLIPNRTHNKTEKAVNPIDTTYTVLNWSPNIRIDYSLNDNANVRVDYRGRSSQPSVSQLVPILDNSNPVSQSLGNPYLNPSFSHNISGEFRYTNRQTFTSVNARINGGFNQNPIVNASWNEMGKTFSMPVNGPTTGNYGGNIFFNTPIAKSNFSVNASVGANASNSASYVGSGIDTGKYLSESDFDYAAFRADYPDFNKSKDFQRNDTRTFSTNGNLTFQYRADALELRVGGNTRFQKSSYSIDPSNDIQTFSNGVNGSVTWTWNLTGMSFKTDANYRWYVGYKTEMPDETIVNAEITKMVFRNRATLALNVYDLLGKTKNFSTRESGNMYTESFTNSLGRYVIISFTWRFGTIGGRGGRGDGQRGGGFGGGRPPMGGGFGGGFGGGRGRF